LVDPGERAALLKEDRCHLQAYPGPTGGSGWIRVDLPTGIGWDEVDELLDVSYRRAAGPRGGCRVRPSAAPIVTLPNLAIGGGETPRWL
jgi:hypothetical protein